MRQRFGDCTKALDHRVSMTVRRFFKISIISAVQHDGTHIVLESGKYNTIGKLY